MEYLTQLWVDWNDKWGAGVAGLAALTLLIIALTEKLHGFALGAWHWKGWARIGQQAKLLRNRYRVHVAKKAMRSKLAETGLRFPVDAYGRCLSADPKTARRDVTGSIAPVRPSWLNDYFVAAALEALFREGKVVKAELCGRNGWPPRVEQYMFRNLTPGKTILEETDAIESDSRCMAYQGIFRDCPTGDRYDYQGYAETVSVRETRFGTHVRLKESAPSCQRCWENLYRERDIRHLVDNITQYDLAEYISSEITGDQHQFQEAIMIVCEINRSPIDVPLIKRAVEQGIAIRRQQLEAWDPPEPTDWPDDLTREFRGRLDDWLKAELQSLQG